MSQRFSYRIDDKVMLVMFAISILFLGIMAFRYKNNEPCGAVDFTYRTSNPLDVAYTNESVYFSSELKYNADSWEWDFGDKTKHDTESGPYATHSYRNPGQYTIRLIINHKCEEVKTINVNRRSEIGKKLYLIPVWPDSILSAGREYFFGDSTEGASTWSWYFDNEPKILQRNLMHMFTDAGVHKVILVVNDDIDHNRLEKTFIVRASPALSSSGVFSKTPVKSFGRRNGGPSAGLPAMNKEPGPSLEDMAASANKIPALSDELLKGHVLNINGSGYEEIKKYLKRNSFDNCTILFNNRPVTPEKLKELMVLQKKYNKSFEVKQSLNTDNNIVLINITASLEAKKRLFLKDKARTYNYD
jgi:PKD repeat protein